MSILSGSPEEPKYVSLRRINAPIPIIQDI